MCRDLVEALEAAMRHCNELREAWERGVLREHDSLGGTRSNRNVEVIVQARDALANKECDALRALRDIMDCDIRSIPVEIWAEARRVVEEA